MTDLQKVELDLFQCFIEVCDKLNLSYFLVCGSALGAARHEGFIPWDDDMDVGMYREDYNKFMELAPELLPDRFFLQNYKSDPKFPLVYAKLRDSKTTYIEKSAKNLDINHGIYIDIFPLDGYPSDLKEQKKLKWMKKWYSYQLNCAFELPVTWKGRVLFSTFRLFKCHKRTSSIVAKYESLISQWPTRKAKIICNHGTWYGSRDFIAAEYYGRGSVAMYEGIPVRVPEKCNEYLTALYGDWRTPPSLERQNGHHYYEICDTEKSYTEYMK